jgi:hypothetical protein
MEFDSGDRAPAGTVDKTTIESLGLKKDEAFGYWFDFGDDWWHQVDLLKVDDTIPRGKFPRETKRIGDSPPQYPDPDEMNEDDDE